MCIIHTVNNFEDAKKLIDKNPNCIILDVREEEELKKGEKIQLVGFGTFEVSERAERTGRNPQTGKEMVIPASKAPKFKAGKALKDMINA